MVLEENENNWGLYDAQGNRLGGEDCILNLFVQKKEYDVIDATELLEKVTRDIRYHGYDKPYRVKLELADYRVLDLPFTFGLDRNAAKGVAMPAKVFKEYSKKGLEEKTSLPE